MILVITYRFISFLFTCIIDGSVLKFRCSGFENCLLFVYPAPSSALLLVYKTSVLCVENYRTNIPVIYLSLFNRF